MHITGYNLMKFPHAFNAKRFTCHILTVHVVDNKSVLNSVNSGTFFDFKVDEIHLFEFMLVQASACKFVEIPYNIKLMPPYKPIQLFCELNIHLKPRMCIVTVSKRFSRVYEAQHCGHLYL